MKKARTRKYEYLYKKLEGKRCIYCGGPQEEYDHCPSIHSVSMFGPDFFLKAKTPFYLLPSCVACNQLLGSKQLFTYAERQTFIYEYLSTHEYDLRMQEPHSEEETKTFSGRLADEIRAHVFLQLRAWERYEWAEKQTRKLRK